MRRKAGLLAAIGALCAAASAAAQSAPADGPPAESDTTIVVTGEKEDPPSGREVIEQARAVSRISRFQLYEEALPRFEGAVCPGVYGVREEYAAAIVERIRANAQGLKLTLAPADCAPNLIVAFVDDSGAFVKRLARKQPAIFKLIAKPEWPELTEEGAPVRVWNNIGLVWTGASAPPPGWPKARPSVRGQLSRGAMPEAKMITSAAVLFEREAVIGLRPSQLADYATMRGLTHTRAANGDEPMETILGLFADGGGGPEGLTSFDLGYLRSLYQGPPNLSAASRLMRIRDRAEDAAEEGGEP